LFSRLLKNYSEDNTIDYQFVALAISVEACLFTKWLGDFNTIAVG